MNSDQCKESQTFLPDLLLEPGAAPRSAQLHLESCTACQGELAALKQTMDVLNGWEAAEPSPFWNARMGARLRQEQAGAIRGGWLERLRTRVWLSNHGLRPFAGAAALGLALIAGGGAWLDLATPAAAPPVQASNTVRDLQSLDENAQVFQQLSSLDGPDSGAQGND